MGIRSGVGEFENGGQKLPRGSEKGPRT